MTEAFDPYRKWLGISRAEQPPHHYRLLSIDLFESDAEVIDGAADRQMAHLRTFQTGPHSADSQKLLNEVSAARICLLAPAKKATYDEQLRRQVAPPQPPSRTTTPELAPGPSASAPAAQPRVVSRPLPTAKPIPSWDAAGNVGLEPAVRITPSSVPTRVRRRNPTWLAPAGVGTLMLTLCAVAYAIWGGSDKTPSKSTADGHTRKTGAKENNQVAQKGTDTHSVADEKSNDREKVLPKATGKDTTTEAPKAKPEKPADDAKSGTMESELALNPLKNGLPPEPSPGKEPLDLLDVDLPGFVPLFNGKDLTGWKSHPGANGNWRVERGILIGSGPATSYLFTDRGDFSNFHLRIKAKTNDGGNSGVFFRSPFSAGWPDGYEAHITGLQSDSYKTGSLFASRGIVVAHRQPSVSPGRPFWMEVIAEGNHVVVKVDGKTTAEYSDDKRRTTSGHLALQQWDARTVVEFHKIMIKESAPVEQVKPPLDVAKKPVESKPSDSKPSGSKTIDGKPVTATDQGNKKEDQLTAQEAFTMKEHTGAVTRVAFHPNPSLALMASAGKDGRVLLWDLDKRMVLGEFAKFREEVWAVKFNTSGELLTFGNRNWWGSVVSFKNLGTKQEIKLLKDFKNGGGAVASLAYSPDDQLIAAGQDDGTIRIWDTTSFPSLQELSPLSLGSNVFSLAFGPVTVDRKHKRSDYLLAAGCKDGSIKLLAVTLAKEKGMIRRTVETTSVPFTRGEGVIAIRFSPDGTLLGATRFRGLISLYDPRTGVTTRQMQASGGNADWISFHPQQPWCVTAHYNDRLARIWNTETGKKLCELPGHTGGVFCAEFSRDGRRVATASDDFSIKLWDLDGEGVPAAPKRSKKAKAPVPIVGY